MYISFFYFATNRPPLLARHTLGDTDGGNPLELVVATKGSTSLNTRHALKACYSYSISFPYHEPREGGCYCSASYSVG